LAYATINQAITVATLTAAKMGTNRMMGLPRSPPNTCESIVVGSTVDAEMVLELERIDISIGIDIGVMSIMFMLREVCVRVLVGEDLKLVLIKLLLLLGAKARVWAMASAIIIMEINLDIVSFRFVSIDSID
jgi:hypothetical protein